MKRIDPGVSYLVWNDAIRAEILDDTFEAAERRFVIRYLRPGMTVLDIGAYCGLYTLIASSKVGPRGQVIAFEPSPNQIRKLRCGLRLNHTKNVRVERLALSSSEGALDFFAVLGGGGGFSGLKRPHVTMETRAITVNVTTLDAYLREHTLEPVNLIKIDVEGGELDVFKGGTVLLGRDPRPVILCELQDARSEAWGHKASDTALFLERLGFRWFNVLPDGSLASSLAGGDGSERNLVAVPSERMNEVEELLAG